MTATKNLDRPASEPAASPGPARWHRLAPPRGRAADALVAVVLIAAALYVTARLWLNLSNRVAAGYGTQDQVLMEWFLAHPAYSLLHLKNPLYSVQMNAPYGINMMAQTSVLGLGIPMIPVTLLFGARVSFVVLIVLALAGTGYAWYHVLSRHVVSNRVAAFLGGAFCGFAPGMISESLGHLHMVAQFLTPFIALQIIRLGDERRWRRNGVILGLLVVYQAFISEEVLFFNGLAVGVFLLVYLLLQPGVRTRLRPFLAGCVIALAVAGVLLAYPLYRQFLGPRHYHGLPFPPSLIYVDLASYLSFPTNSVAGDAVTAGRLAHTTAEETSFLGWPLVLVLLVLGIWLWRRGSVLARVSALTGLIFAGLSLGFTIVFNGQNAHIPGPFRLIGYLPLFDLVVSARLALVVVPFVGILLALGYDQLARSAPADAGAQHRGRVPKVVLITAIVLALAPIVPLPLPTVTVPPTPHFIASGTWKQYVPPNRSLVTVPTTSSFALDGMRWSTSQNLEFAIPRGYFLGPGETRQSPPLYGAVPTWTSIVLDEVSTTGQVWPKQPGDDALFRADLRLWHAAVLVLSPTQAHAASLRQTVEQFLGPAQEVDDVWLWDVRG
jgi:hypothetical protein